MADSVAMVGTEEMAVGSSFRNCRGDGSHGATGGSGTPGVAGVVGPFGSAGDFLVGGITKDQFKTYVWSK
jgi:hypothetical protein